MWTRSRPQLSPARLFLQRPTLIGGILGYCRKQVVTASFQCADDRSGVEWCGGHHYSDPITDPPALKATVDTHALGAQVFTVTVADASRKRGYSGVCALYGCQSARPHSQELFQSFVCAKQIDEFLGRRSFRNARLSDLDSVDGSRIPRVGFDTIPPRHRVWPFEGVIPR